MAQQPPNPPAQSAEGMPAAARSQAQEIGGQMRAQGVELAPEGPGTPTQPPSTPSAPAGGNRAAAERYGVGGNMPSHGGQQKGGRSL